MPVRFENDDFGLGFNQDNSRSCMVADTLAWAAAHEMPFHEALKSLPFYKPAMVSAKPGFRAFVGAARRTVAPLRPQQFVTGVRWKWNLGGLIKDLEGGLPLSLSLRRNIERHLPDYYILGVAKAESEGNLGSALGILAKQMKYPSVMASERKTLLFFGLIKFVSAIAVFTFLAGMVMPQICSIMEELGLSVVKTESVRAMMDIAARVAGALLSLGILVFVLSHTKGIGERVILMLPVIGTEWKRMTLSGLASGMAVLIRQNEDVISAAEWNRKATSSPWLAGKLDKFILRARAGEDWIKAWGAMGLGGPLEEWLVRNAAVRQDPASGFELMAEWLYHEIEFTSHRVESMIDPVITLLMAFFVGGVSYWFFSSLISVYIRLM